MFDKAERFEGTVASGRTYMMKVEAKRRTSTETAKNI